MIIGQREQYTVSEVTNTIIVWDKEKQTIDSMLQIEIHNIFHQAGMHFFSSYYPAPRLSTCLKSDNHWGSYHSSVYTRNARQGKDKDIKFDQGQVRNLAIYPGASLAIKRAITSCLSADCSISDQQVLIDRILSSVDK